MFSLGEYKKRSQTDAEARPPSGGTMCTIVMNGQRCANLARSSMSTSWPRGENVSTTRRAASISACRSANTHSVVGQEYVPLFHRRPDFHVGDPVPCNVAKGCAPPLRCGALLRKRAVLNAQASSVAPHDARPRKHLPCAALQLTSSCSLRGDALTRQPRERSPAVSHNPFPHVPREVWHAHSRYASQPEQAVGILIAAYELHESKALQEH